MADFSLRGTRLREQSKVTRSGFAGLFQYAHIKRRTWEPLVRAIPGLRGPGLNETRREPVTG
jgi:hypothetical protein